MTARKTLLTKKITLSLQTAKIHFVFSLFITLTSCQIMHVTPTHNTPCFTNKKQLEGAISIGATGLSSTLAYSPVKYLSVQASGFLSPTIFYNKSLYNNQVEAAIGGYLPTKKLIFGLNLGYGIGSSVWERQWDFGPGYSSLNYSWYDTKKTSFNFYAAFKTKRDSSSFFGWSCKINYFNDYYHKTTTPTKSFDRYNYSFNQTSVELNFFLKKKMSQKLYFTLNGGICVLPKQFDYILYYPILRIGLLFKI